MPLIKHFRSKNLKYFFLFVLIQMYSGIVVSQTTTGVRTGVDQDFDKWVDRIEYWSRFDLSKSDSLIQACMNTNIKASDLESKLVLRTLKAKNLCLSGDVLLGAQLVESNINQFDSLNIKNEYLAQNHLYSAEFELLKSKFDNSKIELNKAEVIQHSLKNNDLEIEIKKVRGHYFFSKRNYEKSLSSFEYSLELVQASNMDKIAQVTCYSAQVNTKVGEYPKALEALLEMKDWSTTELTKAEIYSSIGRVYSYLNDVEQALIYLNKAIDLKKKVGVEYRIADDLKGLGVTYKLNMNFDRAITLFEEALRIKESQGLYPGSLLGSIANLYNQTGQPDKGREYFAIYKEQAELHNDWEGLCGIYYNQGFYHFSQVNYDLAAENFQRALDIGIDRAPPPLVLMIHDMLSKSHMHLGNEEKSQYHRDEHNKLKDVFDPVDKIKEVGAIEESNDSTRVLAAKQNVVLDEVKKIKIVSRTILFLGVILLLLVAFLLFKRIATSRKAAIDKSRYNTIENYFEELFKRLESNSLKGDNDVSPVYNMPEFLKSQLSNSEGWKSFEKYFDKVHKDFFKNLKEQYPVITANDLNMCALLRLNLGNKDIAQIMGISHDSVRKSQQRLSKKMNLQDATSLRTYILKY